VIAQASGLRVGVASIGAESVSLQVVAQRKAGFIARLFHLRFRRLHNSYLLDIKSFLGRTLSPESHSMEVTRMSKDKVTLNCEQTAVTYVVTSIVGGTRELESVLTRIRKWYIEPMMKMEGTQGFLVLMVLLPLYEMHLKVNGHIRDDEKFSKGHPVFKIMGKHFGLSMDEAYDFWQCFRNGLLHTALPKVLHSFPYSLRTEGPPFERENGVFYLNPFELRNRLLGIIEVDLKKWESHGAHLPVTYIP
jgi:hypothetical protein